MDRFETLHSVAAPLPDADIDTDIIFPARFLLLTDKRGLGAHAFCEKRYEADGRERPDFVFNQAAWRQARIIVAGPNFGCGSSREQAPWALADLGIRCLIAPSFGDIFHHNCLRNGMLPLVTPPAQHALLMAEAQAARPFTVDLVHSRITLADGRILPFDLPERQRQSLRQGWDEIDLVLREEPEHIRAFEEAQRQRMPWLYDAD